MQIMQDENKWGGQLSRGAGRVTGGRSKSLGNVIGTAHRLQERLQQTIKAGGGSNWAERERSVLRHALAGGSQRQGEDRGRRNEVLKCPRCNSLNTKFCYYNNYSLLQPRHFCKNCRRYWTKGGALRNVPVGGGCRKNKQAHALNRNGVSGHCPCSCSTALTANPSSCGCPPLAAAGASTVRNPSSHNQYQSSTGAQPSAALMQHRLPPLPHHHVHYISQNPSSLDLLTSKTTLLQPSLSTSSTTNDFPSPAKRYSANNSPLINPAYPLFSAADCPRLISPHLPTPHCAAARFRSFLSFQQATQSTFAIQPAAASSIDLSHQLNNAGHAIPPEDFNVALQTGPFNDPLLLMGLDRITTSSATAVPHLGTFTSTVHSTSSLDAGMLFSSSSLELHNKINHSTLNEADNLAPNHDGRQMAQELMQPFISSTRSSLQQQMNRTNVVDPGSSNKHELVSDNFKEDQPAVALSTAVNYLSQPSAADHHETYWNRNVPASAWPDRNLSV